MFSRVLPKSYPKAFWHRGAPLLTELVRTIPVPARPCEEAFHAASRQVFLDAVAHGSVIPRAHQPAGRV